MHRQVLDLHELRRCVCVCVWVGGCVWVCVGVWVCVCVCVPRISHAIISVQAQGTRQPQLSPPLRENEHDDDDDDEGDDNDDDENVCARACMSRTPLWVSPFEYAESTHAPG